MRISLYDGFSQAAKTHKCSPAGNRFPYFFPFTQRTALRQSYPLLDYDRVILYIASKGRTTVRNRQAAGTCSESGRAQCILFGIK